MTTLGAHLIFLLLGFLSLSSDVFLAMVVKLRVLLSLYHFFLASVILLSKLSRTRNLFKQSSSLFGFFMAIDSTAPWGGKKHHKHYISLHLDHVTNSIPPHHFMWPTRAYHCLKIKSMLLYFVNYESAYQYHKFLFLYGVLFIRRNGLWCAHDTQWLGLGVWGFSVMMEE